MQNLKNNSKFSNFDQNFDRIFLISETRDT